MFAGNIPGKTNTMTLEIWSAYQAGDDARAMALVLTLTAVSVAVVLAFSRLERLQRKDRR
jgi:molybdate transport system permease protein